MKITGLKKSLRALIEGPKPRSGFYLHWTMKMAMEISLEKSMNLKVYFKRLCLRCF